jgi:hypothetical protein
MTGITIISVLFGIGAFLGWLEDRPRLKKKSSARRWRQLDYPRALKFFVGLMGLSAIAWLALTLPAYNEKPSFGTLSTGLLGFVFFGAYPYFVFVRKVRYNTSQIEVRHLFLRQTIEWSDPKKKIIFIPFVDFAVVLGGQWRFILVPLNRSALLLWRYAARSQRSELSAALFSVFQDDVCVEQYSPIYNYSISPGRFWSNRKNQIAELSLIKITSGEGLAFFRGHVFRVFPNQKLKVPEEDKDLLLIWSPSGQDLIFEMLERQVGISFVA